LLGGRTLWREELVDWFRFGGLRLDWADYCWNVKLLAAMVIVLETCFRDDVLLVHFHGCM
jgi:hypothetical protein